jgi:hypothetical protein
MRALVCSVNLEIGQAARTPDFQIMFSKSQPVVSNLKLETPIVNASRICNANTTSSRYNECEPKFVVRILRWCK